MYVTIVATKYGNCPEYQGAELKVPATREAIQDAMDRARAQGDEAYRMITFRDWPSFLRERLSKIETDIQEVNFLASRVDGMNQEGLSQYEGVLACIETEREGQECSIKDLINASYNMERFELMPGVVTDAGLGEHAVDGDFMRLLQDIPDEVIELLDLSKVGQCLRRSEKGAFTKDGYCFRSSEGWREVHSGRKQSEQALKTELILSVCIRNRDSPEGVEKWLFLPCSDEELTSVCECFHVPNISRFQITGIYSRIPALEEHIGPDEDIGALNELAEKLKAMTPEECLNISLSKEKEDVMKMWLEGIYVGAAYEAAGITAAWQCPEYLKERFNNTSSEYPGVRFDVEADDNALLAATSMTKEISGFTNAIKNSINHTGFGFVFSSDNAQHKGRDIKSITVYKARNLLSNGNEFEPIYKTLVVTYIERMLRFYSGDFKQDKILKFFSSNPNSQKSRWDTDRQYINSILQDGDELDYTIDEKYGICNVLVTFANTTRNLKVQLTRKAGEK